MLRKSSLTTLARCELMNADGIDATNKVFGTSLPLYPTLFLEFWAPSTEIAQSEVIRVEEAAMKFHAKSFTFSPDSKSLDKLWEARRGCYLAALKWLPPGASKVDEGQRVYSSDVCVPISAMTESVSQVEEDFKRRGLPCIICAHIADGNYHCCIPYTPETWPVVHEVESAMIARAIAMGGTVSGEHGVGLGKMTKIVDEHGKECIDVMRRIKKALDPQNILNPGKVLQWDASSCKL
eukprot:c17916_g1_i2.p2 GENE.c17916_g1_i2~~c17916_g1_i2.p2  ORF type:complete len:237 (-),score=45.87 c17916_g1_i2:40-750(-)